MKLIAKILLLIAMTIFLSCNKHKVLEPPESILAGQKKGIGILYFDFQPDRECLISNPYVKNDTSIYLDLNYDGTYDFVIFIKQSNPHQMGSGYYEVVLIPLQNNEICAVPSEFPNPVCEPCMHSSLDWVDLLSVNDSINKNIAYFSKTKSLIYREIWTMGCYLVEGYWKDVFEMNSKYIGFKLVKSNKDYYGWIGFCRKQTNLPTFIITDYAITHEYEE